jgi:arylsulfatase A-like enzyme
MTRLATLRLLPLALVLACTGEAPPPARSVGPDILLVTIDTLRADHLGCYGYFRDTSPNIDALAAESLVFERAYAPLATTLPSHTSLFTGVYPLEHGVLANIKHGGMLFVPAPGLRTLAQGLGELGYRSAGIVSAASVGRATGIDSGFEHYSEPEGHSRIAGETVAEVRDWLKTLREGESFFLWVHFWDPHLPYRAPEEFRDRFTSDDALREMLVERGVEERLPMFLERANRYDEEILYVDDQLGRLLELLRSRGRYQDTLIVLAGDHGESLGEHGEAGHGCVHEGQLRVPLLMRLPGVPPARLDTPVSLVDLLPTLLGRVPELELAGLAEQASGTDRLSAPEEDPLIFAQRTQRDRKGIHSFRYVLIQRDWKLEHVPEGEDLLYDLRNDPQESRNLAADRPEKVREMREELSARLHRQLARGQELRGGAPEEERIADPEHLERLRALGYVD